MVIHLISGRPAGIAYYMDNAHRDYAEDRLHLSNDFMRFAVNNGEDDEYANVTLQEAIARATDPAELDSTPVNSDDEEDPNENTSDLPPSQRPLPVANHEMYLRGTCTLNTLHTCQNPTSPPGALFRTSPFHMLSQTSWR